MRTKKTKQSEPQPQPQVTEILDNEPVIEANEPVKRRRRRKVAVEQLPSVTALGGIWQGIFDTLAIRLGEHWRLAESEKELLGQASFNLLQVYLPELDDRKFALISFAGTVAIVVLPRVMMSRGKGKDEQHSCGDNRAERNGQDDTGKTNNSSVT